MTATPLPTEIQRKLLRLDQILHWRVIGQDEAVHAAADAVIRARSSLSACPAQAGLKVPQTPCRLAA